MVTDCKPLNTTLYTLSHSLESLCFRRRVNPRATIPDPAARAGESRFLFALLRPHPFGNGGRVLRPSPPRLRSRATSPRTFLRFVRNERSNVLPLLRDAANLESFDPPFA